MNETMFETVHAPRTLWCIFSQIQWHNFTGKMYVWNARATEEPMYICFLEMSNTWTLSLDFTAAHTPWTYTKQVLNLQKVSLNQVACTTPLGTLADLGVLLISDPLLLCWLEILILVSRCRFIYCSMESKKFSRDLSSRSSIYKGDEATCKLTYKWIRSFYVWYL